MACRGESLRYNDVLRLGKRQVLLERYQRKRYGGLERRVNCSHQRRWKIASYTCAPQPLPQPLRVEDIVVPEGSKYGACLCILEVK